MDLISGFWYYGVIFLVILTVVVFVHEFGHYLAARWAGVRVEVFSVGFGRELIGWTAKSGTRWRISALPLGGYIRMFGSADVADMRTDDREMSAEEKAVSVHHQSVGKRAIIAAAGPFANFLFGIVVLAGLYTAYGQAHTAPVIGEVRSGSPAMAAGLQAGDKILALNGREVESFQDVQQYVRVQLPTQVTMLVSRAGEELAVEVRPEIQEVTDAFGNVEMVPIIGIVSDQSATEIVQHNPVSALGQAVVQTGDMIGTTFTALGQMITGQRDADQLGGPISIARGAGQAAQIGVATVIFYTVLLSINLGLINLFPIPMLDGGHLLFYAFEAVRGRPLSERAQEYGFRIGLILVFALMLFATHNDLARLPIWDFFKGLLS